MDVLVAKDKISSFINVTKIYHPNMTPHDYSATFDDVRILKLKKYIYF